MPFSGIYMQLLVISTINYNISLSHNQTLKTMNSNYCDRKVYLLKSNASVMYS